jgi:hypothetical protein
VPSYYELNEESGHIILDCDYEYDANESGFVLKWLHNNGNENKFLYPFCCLTWSNFILIFSAFLSMDSKVSTTIRCGKNQSMSSWPLTSL